MSSCDLNKDKNMEELEILYKELQEREAELKKYDRTKLVEGMIAENLLTIARVQQLLIPLVSKCTCVAFCMTDECYEKGCKADR